MEMGLSQVDAANHLNMSHSVWSKDSGISLNPKIHYQVPDWLGVATPAENCFLALLDRRRRNTSVPELI